MKRQKKGGGRQKERHRNRHRNREIERNRVTERLRVIEIKYTCRQTEGQRHRERSCVS